MLLLDYSNMKVRIDIEGGEVFAYEVRCGHLVCKLYAEDGEIAFYTEKMDGLEMTGFGAFRTMMLIRPAIEKLVSIAEELGLNWYVTPTDPRRAALYGRYLPAERISLKYVK